MPYQIPASKRSKDQNRFEVLGPHTGATYTLPSLRFTPPRLVRAMDNPQTGLSGSREMLETYAPGLFDEFETFEEFDKFFSAWRDFSGGIGVGESSSS